MQGLYPIIRRKRRPLVVEESVAEGSPVKAVVTNNVQPAQANADRRTGKAEARRPVKHEETDD